MESRAMFLPFLQHRSLEIAANRERETMSLALQFVVTDNERVEMRHLG